MLKLYKKSKEVYDFKNKKRFNASPMIYITMIAKEVNKLTEKYTELQSYLRSIKDWKAFTEGDLARIINNEEKKIGQESLYTMEEMKEK